VGKEAAALTHWQGQTAETKVLLETHEIIMRGNIRARIPRAAIAAVRVAGNALAVDASDGTLTVELGAATAAKWADYLTKPLPTLAAKLGVGPDSSAFVIGASDDAELTAALAGATCSAARDASVLVAVLTCEADLVAAFAVARTQPELHLWCVYGKGKYATISDAAIRAYLRGQSYVDSKTTGVSDRLTATRYGKRK
jgi:hypothetical protein